MTEAEIVLMSMTNEELDEAADWLARILDFWRRSRDRIEQGDMPADEYRTDAPNHVIHAMDLAIIRERAQRGGAEPWYSGMGLDGHPAARVITYYQDRIALNPDEGHKPRLSAAGILEKICIQCGQAKALSVALWPWVGSFLSDRCRTCTHPLGPVEMRRAMVDLEDAVSAAQVEPVEPFDLDPDTEPTPAPDPALSL